MKARTPLPSHRGAARALLPAVLASAVAAGCDDTFEPYQEDEDAVFSMFGYLDLKADTQWVRVMPVPRALFLDPEPIDAVVTLEHPGSGRIVTLNDSVFRFVDPRLDAVAYAHNFWAAERVQPEATYRLRATRSDGASATAVVVMPPDLEIVFVRGIELGRPRFQVRAERVLFVEVIFGMGRLEGDPPDTVPAASIAGEGGYWTFSTGVPGMHGIAPGGGLPPHPPDLVSVRRQEIRFVAVRADWPYHPGLSDLEITLPNTAPSNVENGLGFVGGVATWTIPWDDCVTLALRPDGGDPCMTVFNAQSASIAGRVIREPCGDPHALARIRLTERFTGGGAVTRTWKTGWRGQYRFEGIEPNAELLLELPAETAAVRLPALEAAERHSVRDISVPTGC